MLKAYVRCGDNIYTVPAIEYDGKLWLVPSWLDSKKQKTSWPERMIRFDTLKYQKTPHMEVDFVLNESIPLAVLDGQTTDGYEILLEPEIPFPLRSDAHRH